MINKQKTILSSVLATTLLFNLFLIHDINFTEINKSCGNELIHENIDLNPNSTDELSFFNSDHDESKYDSVWIIPESEHVFGSGNTYKISIDLSKYISDPNSQITEVRFDTDDRFDFYRTIELTDYDFWSSSDEYKSGTFWSSEGMKSEDTSSKLDEGTTYTDWNEMGDKQKSNQAPYVSTGRDHFEGEYFSIMNGENPQIFDTDDSLGNHYSGVPLEYYNRDDRGDGDGFIHETRLVGTSSLHENKLDISIQFGSDHNRSYVSSYNELYAIHIPSVDIIETTSSLPENITGNDHSEVNVSKSVSINGPSVPVDFKPEEVEFSEDAWEKVTIDKLYMNDSGYGTWHETTTNYIYPEMENCIYDELTGEYQIFPNHSKLETKDDSKSILISTSINYSYNGEMTYSGTFDSSLASYNFENLINDDYSLETFINETSQIFNEAFIPEKGIYGGIFTTTTKYSDIEELLRNNEVYVNIPLGSETNINFYDESGNLVDKDSNLVDGNINFEFEGSGLNDCVYGTTGIISINNPFLDYFEVRLINDYSKSGYKSYQFIEDEGYQNDNNEHHFNINTNDDVYIEFYSKDDSLILQSENFETDENGHKYMTTDFYSEQDYIWGEIMYEKVILNSENKKYIIDINHNSENIFRENKIFGNFSLKNNEGQQVNGMDLRHEIIDGQYLREDVVVYDSQDEILIDEIDEGIFDVNEFISGYQVNDGGKSFTLETRDGAAYNYRLISEEYFESIGGSYLESDEGSNQILAAYDRCSLTEYESEVDNLKENLDAININMDYENNFINEKSIDQLINEEPFFAYYLENELEDYSEMFNFISGDTTVEEYQDMIDFAVYKGILPFALNANGDIINPYEWTIKLTGINGQFVNPSDFIYDRDDLTLNIVHNRTDNENAVYYGSGEIEIEANLN